MTINKKSWLLEDLGSGIKLTLTEKFKRWIRDAGDNLSRFKEEDSIVVASPPSFRWQLKEEDNLSKHKFKILHNDYDERRKMRRFSKVFIFFTFGRDEKSTCL